MTKCDECRKEVDKRFYITLNLPNSPNDMDVSHFKKIEKWVCMDCDIKYHNMFKRVGEWSRGFYKKLQRQMYEDKGDIKKLR